MNLVMNDDTVLCRQCYEEAAEDPIWEASAVGLIFGTTLDFPCWVCDYPNTPDPDREESL